jgi:hypothetical protein
MCGVRALPSKSLSLDGPVLASLCINLHDAIAAANGYRVLRQSDQHDGSAIRVVSREAASPVGHRRAVHSGMRSHGDAIFNTSPTSWLGLPN